VPRARWYVRLHATGRFAVALAAGVLVFFVASAYAGIGLDFLVAWNVGAGVYLALAWAHIAGADATETRRHARAQDLSAYLIFVIVLVAAFASLGAIGLLLEGVKDLPLVSKALRVALSFSALVLSWLLIHTVYAFHYARRYYDAHAITKADVRGLDFPGGENPDYFDFAYYAFTVGMTAEVSDVSAASRHIRRITLLHGVLSFFFNIAIIALSINIIVSVI
jgi:uncharacterized membrane protein